MSRIKPEPSSGELGSSGYSGYSGITGPGVSDGISGYVAKFISATTIADSIITDNGTTVDVVGNLTYLTPPITKSGTDSLTASECKGHVVFVTATGTISLPAVVIGSLVTIYSTTAVAISVDPDNADRIVLDGVALIDGHKVTSASGAGDFVTLYGDSADGWTMIGRSGTWTDGG